MMPRGQRVLSAMLPPAAATTTPPEEGNKNHAAACKSLRRMLLHHCGGPAEQHGTCNELMQLYTRQCALYEEQQQHNQAPAATLYLPPVG